MEQHGREDGIGAGERKPAPLLALHGGNRIADDRPEPPSRWRRDVLLLLAGALIGATLALFWVRAQFENLPRDTGYPWRKTR